MDTQRMLEKCRRDQWSIDDLDWSLSPRALSREHEIAICQYFTDMAGIELLAGALFAVQRDNTEDPVLREIFASFVVDEQRHSEVALRLARHYDVHRYKRYTRNPHLVRFAKHFVAAAKHLDPDIANAYITTGELLLDIALLRSLDDFVDDEMSHRAMRLINRDESRHIAIDYYMTEYYASEHYEAWLAAQPKKSVLERARATWELAGFMGQSRPFFRDVFFAPMDLTDPTGKRLLDAFKHIQLLGKRTEEAARPFGKFIFGLVKAFNDPIAGPILEPIIVRLTGLDPRVIRWVHTREEEARARRMRIEELAEEALGAKGDGAIAPAIEA